MLSPHPLSLLCALLLCLPLALVFTTTPRLSITVTTGGSGGPVVVTVNRHLSTEHEKPLPAKPSPPPPIRKTVESGFISPGNRTINPPPKRPMLKPRPIPEPEPLLLDQPVVSSPPPPPPSPPPPPVDTADDIRLFQRASKVSPDAKIPYPGAPRKIAFMFLTTTPLPFAPLWEQFFAQATNSPLSNTTTHRHNNKTKSTTTNPYYNIYIHADPTYNYTPPFTGVFHNKLIHTISSPTYRNTPTLAAAARRLLAYALLHDKSNHIFLLLSSTCIPLHSFHYTHSKLTSTQSSFIEILANETGAYDRWAARGETAMLPEVELSSFRIGSQFWALNRRHARAVVKDVHKWRKFKLPCVRLDTCYPEENYFPTIVAGESGDGDVVPATLTHVDWSGSWDGHPKMYNESEVGPDLITKLRNQPLRYGDGVGSRNGNVSSAVFLFARKFAPECLSPLLNISSDVIFRDF